MYCPTSELTYFTYSIFSCRLQWTNATITGWQSRCYDSGFARSPDSVRLPDRRGFESSQNVPTFLLLRLLLLLHTEERTGSWQSTSGKQQLDSREEWDRRREASPRDREHPGLYRTVLPRSGRLRSSSRERAYSDSQRDVNEGTINVLRSMHAKLMTLQGQTGKNSGYPYFDEKFWLNFLYL